MGKEVSEKEKLKLQRPKPVRKDYNQWKWADVIIDTEKFAAVLKDVANTLAGKKRGQSRDAPISLHRPAPIGSVMSQVITR